MTYIHVDNDKVTGITFGAFDLFHAGHIAFLEACKDNCDFLSVGLHTNPFPERLSKNTPTQSTYERWEQLRACRFIDEVIPYDTELDLKNILNTYTFEKRFLGSEYINDGEKIIGYDICQRKNIEIVFFERSHTYSSSELRKRIYGIERIKHNSIKPEPYLKEYLRD